MRSKELIAGLAVLTALASPSVAVAHSGVSLSARGTAVIDGVLAPGEWNAAGALDFVASTPDGPAAARMYVMNDNDNLYLAIRVARPTLDSSSPVWEFDNDHDGQFFEEGDDALVLNAHAGFFDDYRTQLPPCPPNVICGLLDTQGGGTNDGAGVARNDGAHSTYEVSHPLASGDQGHDFNLKLGDTVGFLAFFRICTVAGCFDAHIGPGDIVIAAGADRTPPESTIDAAPGAIVNVRQASIGFSGADDQTAPGALEFECSVDGGPFAPCVAPLALSALADGPHVVLVQALDEAGNVDPTPAEARWVVDTTPPELALAVSADSLWPPNHRLVSIGVSISFSDANGASAWLESVTSDEPDHDGSSSPDVAGAEIGTLDEALQLRAERAGGGDGRVYTLTYRAVDAAGNESTSSIEVVVPHDHR